MLHIFQVTEQKKIAQNGTEFYIESTSLKNVKKKVIYTISVIYSKVSVFFLINIFYSNTSKFYNIILMFSLSVFGLYLVAIYIKFK